MAQSFAVTGVPAGAEIGIGKTWYHGGQPYFGFARIDRTEALTYAAVRARWFAKPLGELEVAQRSFSQLP